MNRAFNHIVVGCDGSPEGRDAVVLGATIAAATGADLTLLGVFSNAVFPIRGVTDRRTVRRHAEAALRAERRAFAPDAMVHAVADFSVPHALRRHAEQRRADLVIVGSERSAEDGQAKISRRGRQLVQNAPFAVAIAARGLHERQFKLASIGVGYDGGGEADVALATAATLARPAGATVSVLSVVEDRVPRMSGSQWMRTSDWAALHDRRREDALVAAKEAAALLDVSSEIDAIVGDPGLRMVALSKTCDLVVVGSRRWGAIARIVFGSVGETLVTGAGCSVMVVPRPLRTTRNDLGSTRSRQRAGSSGGSHGERDGSRRRA